MKRTPGSNTRNYLAALADHQWRVLRPSADLQDNNGVCFTLLNCYENLPSLKVIFGDSAYKRSGLPEFIKSTLGWIPQPVLRPAGISGLIVLPKRRIAERTSAWISRARRNAKDHEKNRGIGRGDGSHDNDSSHA